MEKTTNNVRILPGLGKRSPEAMLECMKGADLESVTIIGWDSDGLFTYSSSHEFNRDILWDLEQTKRVLLE